MTANKTPPLPAKNEERGGRFVGCDFDGFSLTSIPSVISHAATTMEIHNPPCGRPPTTIWWRQTAGTRRVHYLWLVVSTVSAVHSSGRWDMQLLRDNRRTIPRRPHHSYSRRGDRSLQQSGGGVPFLQPIETRKRRAHMARTAQDSRKQAYETTRAGPFEKASGWGGDGHGELTPTGSSWNGPVWTPERCDVLVKGLSQKSDVLVKGASVMRVTSGKPGRRPVVPTEIRSPQN